MIIIRKPEEEELLPLVREASHDGAVPDEEWQKHFLKIFEKGAAWRSKAVHGFRLLLVDPEKGIYQSRHRSLRYNHR